MMREAEDSQLNEALDIIAQNPRLSRLYTHLCFCFQVSSANKQEELDVQAKIADYLQLGLRHLVTVFPWTAGQVVQSANGVYRIVSLEPTPRMVVKDIRDRLPSYQDLQKAGFPFHELDEDLLAARGTFPERFNKAAEVFLLQVNFIKGGALVCFSAQHNCMDMAGQCEVIRLLAKACRNESFNQEETATGNLPRKTADNKVLDKLDNGLLSDLISDQRPTMEQIREPRATEQDGPKGIWAYFVFSSKASQALKKKAMQTLPEEFKGFISTDDAISALIWQRVTRARVSLDPRMNSLGSQYTFKDHSTKFERQINARPHLGISSAYPGCVVHKVSTGLPVSDVLHEPLGYLASELRESLHSSQPEEIVKGIRDDAQDTLQAIAKGRTISGTPGSIASDRPKVAPFDIKMSSWAKEQCHLFDFGGHLGQADAVRRTRFAAWPGLAYLMPKGKDGSIVAAICLTQVEMHALLHDEEMDQYALHIG